MKGVTVFLLVVMAAAVTAKHRKEWQRIDPARAAREHFQPFYKPESCGKGAGFYRDPQDCHQYIRCVDEFGSGRHFSIFVGRCEPGLVFDENISSCNWPELAAPCSSSPDKLQVVRKPDESGISVQDNIIHDRERPFPVQQQVVQTPHGSGPYKPPQEEGWEVHIVHPPEHSNGYEPEVTWQQVLQTTQSQAYDPQQKEVAWEGGRQEIQQEKETGQYPQQEQSPINQQQHFEPSTGSQGSEQQVKDERPDSTQQQRPSGAFEEVEEHPQREISANVEQGQSPEQQSQWWIQENSAHSPPEHAEQIPASEAGDKPLFCEREGFFSHPDYCNRFIRCVKSENAYSVHVFECPKQLVFNEKNSACVVDEEQSCQTIVRQKRQAPSGQLKCRDEGFFRHPQDCRAFYRCVKTDSGSYETHPFSCPANLVFDEEYTTCNWPEKAPPCEAQDQQFKKKKKPTQTERPYKPRTTQKPRNDFLDKAITEETFNGRRTAKPKPTAPQGGAPKCRSEGFFSNEKDCTKFFKCVRRGDRFIRYDLSCPNNYGFDDRSKRCVAQRFLTSCSKDNPSYPPPRQADEETTARPETTSASQSDSGDEEIVCEQEGYFRHPKDCNKFYRCVDFNGDGQELVRYDFNCPEGLIFDEGNSVCNWPEPNSPCETRSGGSGQGGDEGSNEGGEDNGEGPGEGGSEGTGEENPEDAGESEGSNGTGDGGNDNQDGMSSVSGEETSTEPARSTSDASNEIPEEQGGDGSQNGNSGSNGECTKEGYYRNPEDCNKFYRCVDFEGDGKEFVRYDFACPDGLVFDEANSVCNWPEDSEPCDTKSSEGTETVGSPDGSDSTNEEGQTEGGEKGTEATPEDGGQGSSSDKEPATEQSTSSSPTESSDSSEQQGGSSQSPGEPTAGGGNEAGSSNSGECTEEGFFRNPDDCNKFYRCVDQNEDGKSFTRYDFKCPEGLVFDEANSVCNWPDQSAPCEDGGSSGGQSTTGAGGDGSQSSQTPEGDGASQTTSDSGGTSQTTAGNDVTSSEDAAGQSSTESTSSDKTTDSADSGQTSSPTSGSESTASGGGEGTSDSSGGSSENTGECTEEGYFRNPEDCGKFYRCVDFNGDGQQFVRYDFDCPEGLVFDEVNSVCNWPDQTPGCETSGGSGGKETTSGDGTSSQTESSTTQSSGSSDQPAGSTSQQPAQGTEQSTQSTDQSTSTTTRSPAQSTTAQTQSSSDQPGQTSTQQATSEPTSTGDSSCSQPGFFRCEDDCNKFYRCVEEGDRLVRYDFKCPDGLIFDDQNKRCDWPSEDLNCESSSTSAGSTGSSTSSGTSDRTTSQSTSTKESAPASTTESTSTALTTESGTSAQTSQQSSTTQSSTRSSDTTSSEIECTEEGYFRNPDDCSKYYRCIDEGDGTLTREDFACAEDEVFDEEMRFCNRKDLAPPCDSSETTSTQSATSSTTTSTQSETSSTTASSQTTSNEQSTTGRTTQSTTQSTSESSTTGKKSDCTEPGFFRCPEDCTKFYRCVENDDGNLVRYDFHCPDGLIFDEQKKKCDFPSSELTCDDQASTSSTQSSTSGSQTTSESSSGTSEAKPSSERTTSSGTSTTSSSGSTNAEGCTEEGFFRNPDDCSKYYRCMDEGDGTLTREDFACEEDEVFDEEMRFCNRKDLAPPCDENSSTTASSTTSAAGSSTTSTTSSSASTTEESTPGSTSSGQSTTGSSQQGTESTAASTSSESSGQSSGECQEEGFHRDPNDCGKFYRCVDFEGDGQSFTRYDFECPEGLVFDETNDVCNWPSSVPSCESSGSGNEGTSTTAGESAGGSSTSGDRTSSTSVDESSATSSEGTSQSTTEGGRGSESSTTSAPGSGESSSSTGTTQGGGSESTQGSSNDIECTEEGFFRHPEDCGKFYRCVDFAGTGESYVRYDFDCPEGLVFDEVNSVCNWPNQSPKCEAGAKGSSGGEKDSGSSSTTGEEGTSSGSGSSTQPGETTTSSTSGSTTPNDQSSVGSTASGGTTSSASDEFRCEEEGYFRHPTDCKKYYECKRDEETGELVKIDCECPDGHVWDNEAWYCNAEELSPPCEGSGSEGSPFQCSKEGFFRDPEDCTKYHRCTRRGDNEFESERFQCDDGLVFDEEGRYCNAPELSEPCDGSSSTAQRGGSTTDSGATGSSSSGPSTAGPGASGSTSSGTSSSDDCTREGFFRSSEDCTKYYQCSRNEETGDFDRSDHSCPDGRIFDEQSNYCNEPELSEEPCDTDKQGSSTTQQSTSGSTSSTSGSGGSTGTRRGGSGPQCSQEGFFRHPDDCNKFYRCVDFSGSGESYVRYDFDCPEGLHFDEVNSVCNWPTMTPACESSNQFLRRYLGVIN